MILIVACNLLAKVVIKNVENHHDHYPFARHSALKKVTDEINYNYPTFLYRGSNQFNSNINSNRLKADPY